MKRHTIDLNCDLGEGMSNDAAIMPVISSANIACGAHAGDLATMRETVALAKANGVAIGAHPGFADRENFGRKELRLKPRDLEQLVVRQIAALRELTELSHVKPHGALYNLAARDRDVAEVFARAIQWIDPDLLLFAPSGSELARAGREAGLRVAEEVFADRTYQGDGTLTPRSQPRSTIEFAPQAIAQACRMIEHGEVEALDGTLVKVTAETICLHGDHPHAVAFARELRTALAERRIDVRAPAAVQIS